MKLASTLLIAITLLSFGMDALANPVETETIHGNVYSISPPFDHPKLGRMASLVLVVDGEKDGQQVSDFVELNCIGQINSANCFDILIHNLGNDVSVDFGYETRLFDRAAPADGEPSIVLIVRTVRVIFAFDQPEDPVNRG